MPSRLKPFQHAVDILHDGDLLPAEAGEPLVHTLLGADRLLLARSPKLHRPRGPYCLQAACDGCLVRVDGVANVMACRVRVRGGETVETQNVLGSRNIDLLAATDFMFPRGLDPHRLFAGVRGVSPLVQRLARRIAGLGRLPDEALERRAAHARDVDTLVIGGGQAGLSMSSALGPGTVLVDDALELGGALRALDPESVEDARQGALRAGVELLGESTACGLYREPQTLQPRLGVLVATPRGVVWLRARSVVLATGTHAAVPEFPGNDLPGVFSARAGLELLRGGVLPAERVVVVGEGRFADVAAEQLGPHLVGRVQNAAEVKRLRGVQRVRGVELNQEGGGHALSAGALLFDSPASPAFELAVQAGAELDFDVERGYVPRTDARGRVAERVWCVGSASGAPSSPDALRATAADIRAVLEAP